MSGWQRATITDNEVAGPNLHRIALSVPASIATAFRVPGQFVRVCVDDAEAMFSMASAPGVARFEFLIRTIGDVAQAWAALPVGSHVELGTPEGPGFPLERTRGHSLLLVGTGSGFAPLRSVLLTLLPHRADWNRVDVIYGVMTPEHVVFDDEFAALAPRGVGVQVAVTEPMDDWTGPVGRVQDLLPRGGLDDTFAFLCGQPEMTAEVTSLLTARGVAAERVFLNY